MKGLYALVGMKHRGTEGVVARLPNGAPLALKREPDNAFDPLAVQVWARPTFLTESEQGGAVHVGYLKASQGHPLARLMDQNAELSARLNSGFGVKLAIDGGKWPLVEVEE